MSRMRFGIFMAPFHPAGENPTLLIDQDLDLVTHLDLLGYDEAWIGEHHSAGSEVIASPEIFIAAAAERTNHIKLGSGVISASYHNPLWVAERAVQLDHMTKGRFILGLGPGALPSDGRLILPCPASMLARCSVGRPAMVCRTGITALMPSGLCHHTP